MFSNYFKTGIRNLFKNKAFSLINILGLALGMACSLLIWMWVQDERGMDSFHANQANLYRVYERQYHDNQVNAGYGTPGPLSGGLKDAFPEVKYATGMAWRTVNTFEGNGKILKETGDFGSPDFFHVFSYPLLEGNAETAVKTTIDIAISRKMAEDFFGSPQAAIGQALRLQNKKDLKVSAVFENLPTNSSQQFDYILNWETFQDENTWSKDWGNQGPATYLVLQAGANVKSFESKIEKFLDHFSYNKNFLVRLFLQRNSDVYLHSNFKGGEISGGRIEYVILFTVVAMFVLLIACINFMNLTTVRALRRSKEVGVRKVIGALRGTLILQFIGEALLIVFAAVVVGLVVVALTLPVFNSITQKNIVLPLGQISFWLAILGLTLFTGFISGYPALYLSSFSPASALKGSLKFSLGARWFRKGLVVFQFSLSILLIIGTIVISRQVHYIQSANLGYDRENLIYLPMEGEITKKYDLFKEQALAKPGIKMISRISQSPTSLHNGTGGLDWDGKDPNALLQFTQAAVGYDFMKTMNIDMVEGRDYSRNFASDSVGYIVNEAALKVIGYKDPIGKPLTFWGKKGFLVGITKDFHFTSLHNSINPLVLRLDENFPWGCVLVRTEPGKTKEALASCEKLWTTLNPSFPFTYQFSDEEYRKLYGSEQIVEMLSNAFALLAIFISCLGILGLAMFTAEQRTKEVGLRKILGASLSSLFKLLSKELFGLVTLSIVIASPVAWVVMKDWLKAYAYQVEISWWMFLSAGVFAIIIALLTVSFQTIKALIANPVNSIKSE